jgi:hypothetical protein
MILAKDWLGRHQESDNFRKINLLSHGIRSSVNTHSLQPLLRSIEICLDFCDDSALDKASVFSCDSFCKPHLDFQCKFLANLPSAGFKSISFLNVPVAHYVTSTPNPVLLSCCADPLAVAKLNEKLVLAQDLSQITKKHEVNINQKYEYSLYEALGKLYGTLPDSAYQSTDIKGFAFHELYLRDLSLTYKILPEEALELRGSHYPLFRNTVQLSLWLILHLLCQDSLGRNCFNMSFYGGCGVFRFFCKGTGRSVRFFEAPFINADNSVLDSSNMARILDSPSQRIYTLRQPLMNQIHLMTMKPEAVTMVKDFVFHRFNGIGSHTYSGANQPETLRENGVLDKLESTKNKGGKVVTLFTSSDDESVGLQLDYVHEKVMTEHLSASPFRTQSDWIDSTIDLFRQHPNYHLFIRFHPRLASDKRGLPEAPSFNQYWKNLFKATSHINNITLIHPSSSISSYALGLAADLVLNGWSTIGLELAIAGKSVTNAFYKCTTGAAPIYAVHLDTPLLRSVEDYQSRILKILTHPKEECQYLLSSDEAMKALLVFSYSGCVFLDSGPQLKAQLIDPQLLTPCFFSLFIS